MSFLGKAAYQTFYRPLGFIKRLGKHDGFPQTFINQYRERCIRKALDQLPPFPQCRPDNPIQAHYLTGRSFFSVTAMAYASFAHYAGDLVTPVFFTDGTLDEALAARFRRLFPGCKVVTEEENRERIEKYLPASRYPSIRKCRELIPITCKLFDIHAGNTGWKIYLDSDTAFFRRPEYLVQWAAAPHSCHLMDIYDAYGCDPEQISCLLGCLVRRRVNAGLVALRSESIDFDLLERWTAKLLEWGPSWFTEQCLTAMLMTILDGEVTPPDYIVVPDEKESRAPKGTFHHYAGPSRPLLYRYAWFHTLNTIRRKS